MDFVEGWALGGSEEGPEHFIEGGSVQEVLDVAQDVYPKHTQVMFEGDIQELVEQESARSMRMAANAGRKTRAQLEATLRNQPVKAAKATGLPRIDFNRAMRMSTKEAHALLLPHMLYEYESLKKVNRGALVEVKAYDSPAGLANALISQNAKMAKGTKLAIGGAVPPGLSKGPGLLPHAEALKYGKFPMAKTVGICVGSSAACRALCLVNTGQNALSHAPTLAKLARTRGLYAEPEAWVRMFVESIRKHVESCRNSDYIPYVRPNVFSDIPWEIICPEIFEVFRDRKMAKKYEDMADSKPLYAPDLIFYDYTKVAGRDVSDHPNYDLTFSFSGDNWEACDWELDRGSRLAVVVWVPKPCRSKQRIEGSMNCNRASDYTFLGREMLDGDDHDFRNLDPAGSIIGLTYKTPTVWDEKRKRRVRLSAPPEEGRAFALKGFGEDMEPRLRLAVAGPKEPKLKWAIKATKDRRTGTIFKSLVPGDTGDVEEMFGDVGASQLMAK
ncbi:MAG: hypothetical protein EBS90_11035 [Betaproteobacteria bacterium]|nr:hypothetical protein [Betaproteobacteria bacterium]